MKKYLFFLYFAFACVCGGCKEDDGGKSELLLDLTPGETSYNSVSLTVTPSNSSATYYAGIVLQKDYAAAVSDPVFMDQVLSGLKPGELQKKLLKGLQPLKYGNLDAGATYCAFAFGVGADGKANSALFKVEVNVASLLFAITITERRVTSMHIEVVPQDMQATYITVIADRNKVDSFVSDEACYQSDMDYISEMAALLGKTFEQQLGELLIEGEYTDDITGLIPGTEYYAYAYGVTSKGERTTDIFRVPFETEPLQMVDCTFEVDNVMEYSEVTLTVRPSKDDVPYYAGIIDEETYLECGGDEAANTFQEWFTNELGYYQTNGKTLAEALGILTRTGDSSRLYDKLLPEKPYHICVFAVDAAGYIVSEIEHIPFTTGTKRPSNNVITITVNPAEITSTSAIVRTTATNDSYYILYTEEASAYAGMTDDEIIGFILDDWGSDITMIRTKGAQTRNVICSPDRDYLVTAFGYMSGAATTQLYKYAFHTPASGSAAVGVASPAVRNTAGTTGRVSKKRRIFTAQSRRACVR